MRKVRKSWAPGKEVEVPEHDYVDLLRQGLLVDGNGKKVTKYEPLPKKDADQELSVPEATAAKAPGKEAK